MADVTGPISTLPGHRRKPPPGTKCDEHPDRDATVRIQGETDSFGSEQLDACDECDQRMQQESQNPEFPMSCDSCPSTEEVKPVRDPDEGMAGPVYYKCKACRKSLFDYHSQRDRDDDDYLYHHPHDRY